MVVKLQNSVSYRSKKGLERDGVKETVREWKKKKGEGKGEERKSAKVRERNDWETGREWTGKRERVEKAEAEAAGKERNTINDERKKDWNIGQRYTRTHTGGYWET